MYTNTEKRYPIIAIEGADGVGKSTLSENLDRILNAYTDAVSSRFTKETRPVLQKIHFPRPELEKRIKKTDVLPVNEAFANDLIKGTTGISRFAIYDRWFFSNLVYNLVRMEGKKVATSIGVEIPEAWNFYNTSIKGELTLSQFFGMYGIGDTLCIPDIVIIICPDEFILEQEVSQSKKEKTTSIDKDLEFQKKINARFKSISDMLTDWWTCSSGVQVGEIKIKNDIPKEDLPMVIRCNSSVLKWIPLELNEQQLKEQLERQLYYQNRNIINQILRYVSEKTTLECEP